MNTYSNIGLLILRLFAGVAMLPHGISKLQMLLNGNASNFLDPIGIGATPSLILALFAELGCTLLVMLGFFTRPAAAILAINMAVASYFLFSAGKPFESGIEQGIYTAIFAQYMAMLVYDCKQEQYLLPFLLRNIKSGWQNRDVSRNLCGGEYYKKLDEGAEVDSYSASGIPALMLLFSR